MIIINVQLILMGMKFVSLERNETIFFAIKQSFEMMKSFF